VLYVQRISNPGHRHVPGGRRSILLLRINPGYSTARSSSFSVMEIVLVLLLPARFSDGGLAAAPSFLPAKVAA